MNSIYFQGVAVNVMYVPRLKHSYLRVKSDSLITIRTPIKSTAFIYNFLEDKKLWIEKQLILHKQNKTSKIKLQEEILFFGKIYSVKDERFYELYRKIIKINKSDIDKLEFAYNEFYKSVSKEYISQRVDFFANKMSLDYKKIKFRKMKSRWGSCSSKKELTFNTQLIKIDKELIDYVIVHELSHLVHMNHSKEFHSFVQYYLNDSKNLRKRLKKCMIL